MNIKLIILYSIVCNYLVTSVWCKRSYTLVIDNTESMEEELRKIKSIISAFFQSVTDWSEIENFILIPFNDPDVGPPLVFNSQSGLIKAVTGSLSISGGGRCPENSLAAIEMALAQSRPESYIFVFTDAYATHNNTLSSIVNYCHSTHSQVYIFLSGECINEGILSVYYDTVTACAGNVFRISPSDLRQAFSFMAEIVKMKLKSTDVLMKTSFMNRKISHFPVEPFTSGVFIEVFCENPSLRVSDPDGENAKTEIILKTSQSMVVQMNNPNNHRYDVTVDCKGSGSLTINRHKKFPFALGFCTRPCQDMKETSSRPVEGANYILILVPENYHVKLNDLKMKLHEENITSSMTLQALEDNQNLYVTNAVFELKSFVLSVSGENLRSHHRFSVSTNIMEPQELARTSVPRSSPKTEIVKPKTTNLKFGSNITIPCRITANPKPSTWWETDRGNKLNSANFLIQRPNIYVDYVTLQNVTANISIYCKSQNILGLGSDQIQLNVYKPFKFNILQKPEDNTFEYGAEGKLFCEIDAYPEAITKWYHNKTLIEATGNKEILREENTLLIKEMTLEEVGEYICEVSNIINSKNFTATVTISNIEKPRVEINQSKIVLKPGQNASVQCSVIEGKPLPDVVWKFKGSSAFSYQKEDMDLPKGVFINDEILKIIDAKNEHSGEYTCKAENVIGFDAKDVQIKVQYAPIIQDYEMETMTVKEGEHVDLRCDVDAQPPAKVRWEMSQDDVIIMFDDRHVTDKDHTHRFDALWKDSGHYHCIAENEAGKAEITININVLVPPYIQAPQSMSLTVRAGESITLMCNVLYGNPVPSTKWEFTALNFIPTLIKRGNTTNPLHIENVSKDNEGVYMCIAENHVGSDNIRIHLKVQ